MIRDRRAILALLTALNFLNYIDRYVIAAVVAPMQKELQLSNLEAGLLSSAFLVGYFLTSPWFGARADRSARKPMIAVGVLIWSLGTVASGLAIDLWTMLAARIVVGVGEASFATLAPTIIDDVTPPDRRGKALAIFYLALPAGSALGYVLGGAIAGRDGANWHYAFFLTGAPGALIALTCLLIAEPQRKLAAAQTRLVDSMRALSPIPLFRRSVFGYCAYAAAVGAFSYWAPKYLVGRYSELDLKTANFWFGIAAFAAGIIATLVGGWWMDRRIRRLPPPPDGAPFHAVENRRRVNVMLWVCAVGMAVAAPLTALCFFLPATGFFAVAFLAELGLFLSTSPVAAACMSSVPPERRASAMALTIFAIHAFGDLWSPPLLGLLQDHMPPIVAMMLLPLTIALAAYLWWPRAREAAGPSSPGGGELPQARVRSAT